MWSRDRQHRKPRPREVALTSRSVRLLSGRVSGGNCTRFLSSNTDSTRRMNIPNRTFFQIGEERYVRRCQDSRRAVGHVTWVRARRKMITCVLGQGPGGTGHLDESGPATAAGGLMFFDLVPTLFREVRSISWSHRLKTLMSVTVSEAKLGPKSVIIQKLTHCESRSRRLIHYVLFSEITLCPHLTHKMCLCCGIYCFRPYTTDLSIRTETFSLYFM